MAKYTPDHKGTGEFLMSRQLARGTRSVAERVAAVARSTAPRSANPEDGHYANGIEVHEVVAGIRNDRIGYEVVATEGHPTLVEWGRSPGGGHPGYPPHRTLHSAAEAVANE